MMEADAGWVMVMVDGLLEENCNQVSNIPTMTSLQLEYKCTVDHTHGTLGRDVPVEVVFKKSITSLGLCIPSVHELNMTNEVRILISREIIMPCFKPIWSLITIETDFCANIYELQ